MRSRILKLSRLFGLLALALSSGAARADRLIWIPTASIAHLQADYTQEAFGKAGVVTGQIGLGKQFELMVRHYKDFGVSDKTEVGGQYQVLPEGIATPALSIGVWDVADDGPAGRRIFGVISKTVPLVNYVPLGIHDVKFHAGVGSNRLSGVFAGGQVGFPFGFGLYAEYDARDVNAGISWSPIKLLRLKAESWRGHIFVGGQLSSPF
jgi:hypothetical protein